MVPTTTTSSTTTTTTGNGAGGRGIAPLEMASDPAANTDTLLGGDALWRSQEGSMQKRPSVVMMVQGGEEGDHGDDNDGAKSRENVSPLWRLYGSHFLSAWAQRSWEFLVGVIMVQISSDLVLVSLFGCADSVSIVLLAGYIGRYIDTTERYEAARIMYLVQNVGMLVSGLGCAGLLKGALSGFLFWALAGVSIVAACASSVGATGATISVEREWTKAIHEGGLSSDLAKTNAIMKRIDLVCLIASPIFIGVLAEESMYLSLFVSSLWNVVSWPIECILLKQIQNMAANLKPKRGGADPGERTDVSNDTFISHVFTYFHQKETLYPAFALALLYLTVMSFGTVMTGYLVWSGIGEVKLSMFRGYVFFLNIHRYVLVFVCV